ncbi:putative Bcr/CflA family efflux transporter [Candidatus Xenohaliotis californiensis]|uniref:Bcr/CflA family efflux transporter n=1 Tax=Candidatus Xenohaliotis californiensis TaxID=84677 RepID=A0ABP0EW95_9RICK|nr:putative Bcr/CflA family efflux transporter [Candidatus Xenohaliotis californiensis]
MRLNRYFSIVLCCIFNTTVVEMTCEAYVPSLPTIKNFFNSTEYITEFIVVAYLVGLSISGIIFGPISDLVGRKKIMIGGSLLFLLSSFLCYWCYFMPSIYILIFANFMQGFGGGAAMISSFAGVCDKYFGVYLSNIMTRLNVSISIAPVIGSIAGSIILYCFDWHYIPMFLTLVSLLLLVINLNTEEINHVSHVELGKDIVFKHIFESYRNLFKNKTFILFTLIQTMTIATIWGEVSNLPFVYIQSMKSSNLVYGFIIVLIMVSYVFGAFLNQCYADKIGRKQMIYCGVLVTIFFNILIVFCHYKIGLNPFLLTILKLPTSFVLPFVTINSSTIALNAVKNTKGASTAFLESAQTTGGALYVFLLSLFYDGTMLPMSILSIIVFAGILVLHAYISENNPDSHYLTA